MNPAGSRTAAGTLFWQVTKALMALVLSPLAMNAQVGPGHRSFLVLLRSGNLRHGLGPWLTSKLVGEKQLFCI